LVCLERIHFNLKDCVFNILLDSWNRWGRVGERGSDNGLDYYHDVNDAIKAFEKKFKDKTGNNWKDRENFVAKSGK
jgi:poly [ADP-ribose] polymerase